MKLLSLFLFSTSAFAEQPVSTTPAKKPNKQRKSAKRAKDFSHKPYWNPIVAGHIFNANNTSYYGLNVGLEGGFIHKEKVPKSKRLSTVRLIGRTRALATTVLGSGISSTDVHVGSFWGPWYGIVGSDIGPDLIFNSYSIANTNIDMGTATALAIPGRVYFNLFPFSLIFGAGPTFYTSGDRQGADWEALERPYFGDEFSYFSSANLKLGPIRLGVTYLRRFTGYGDEQGIGFGFSL